MTIRKRGKHYEFGFCESGQRYSGTFNGKDGTELATSMKHARQLEFEIRKQISNGSYAAPKKSTHEDFCTFFDDVFMTYSKQNKRSWQHDKFRGEVLKEYFSGLKFREISPLRVVSFINARLKSETKRKKTRSPVTVNKEVRLLSSVFIMAINEQLATSNPCALIPRTVKARIPARNKRDRVLSEDEEKRLFANLIGRRSHLAPLVRFALETGLRRGELFRLEADHINLTDDVRVIEVDGKQMRVEPNSLLVTKSKNGKPRTVPLSAEAFRVAQFQLADATTGKYLFTGRRTQGMVSEIKTGFRAALTDAGIADFRFHDARHAFASRLNESGADPFVIRDLLGHTTTNMTADYTHTTLETRRKAIEAMGGELRQNYDKRKAG